VTAWLRLGQHKKDPFCRHFIVESGFDVREILFYTALVPALNDLLDKSVPKSGEHDPFAI